MDAEEFRTAIQSEATEARKVRAFAALLGRESGLGAEGMTVVGGSALEIYTGGAYVSQDVDLIAEDRSRVESVLRQWGFKALGMYWTSPDLTPSIQIVGRHDSWSRERNQIISTRFGQVRLASIEDVVVKRLIESRYWRQPQALAEAMLAVERLDPKIDWEYVEFVAKKDGVVDLASDIRRRAKASRGKKEPSRERRTQG